MTRASALLLMLLSSLVVVSTTAAADGTRSFARQFANPGTDVRPKADWFLPDSVADIDAAQLEREIPEIAAAGLAGVDVFNVDMALTAGESDLLKRALVAAKANGVTLDLTVGAAFPPVTVPTVTPGSGVEQQELVYGTAVLDGGVTFDGPVPEPEAVPGRPATLVAVVAARCVATCSGERPVLLDPDSLRDLTEISTSGNEIRWTAPGGPGQWVLFGFWRRSTATPYADYFSAKATKAVTDYWDEHVFTPELEPLLAEVAGELFEDSLHLEGFQLWTRHLLSEFERRRGYSLRKYLPITVIPYINDFWVNVLERGNALNPDAPADFDFAGDAGRRIRNDYYQTLSELYEEHHLVPLNAWARSHGLEFRAKASYSQTFDISAGTAVDVPNTESFQHGNRLDGNRAMAGVAHLGRKDRLAVECCPTVTRVYQDAYSSTWQRTLAVLHGTYAVGANQVMLHGFAYGDAPDTPWPGAFWPFVGTLGPGLAEAHGPHQPYWRHMPDVTAFLGREQLVLRQGQPKVDVAVYRHSYWSSGFPLLTFHVPQEDWLKDKTLERAGYSYDFVGPALFELPNARVGRGRLDPEGPAYKALILDTPEQVNSVDGMPLSAAKRILEYARAGLPVVVVGEPPDRTGFLGDAADDAAVRRTIARLLAQPNVRRVARERDIAGALADLGLGSDFAPHRPSNVLGAHRASKDIGFYFLYNRNTIDAISGEPSPEPTPFDQWVTLTGRGRPYVLDAWTGAITRVATWKRVNGGVRMRVTLTPGESTIIALAPKRWLDASATTDDTVAGRPLELTNWDLSVEDWRPGATPTETIEVPHELQLESLRPWSQIPELEDVSGVGRYTTDVALGRRWIARRRVRLDLGPVTDSVRAWVNGVQLPPIDPYNAVVDVTRHLRTGTNRIEVEVATTLRNRLRTLPEYPAFAALERADYGLTGPVRLIPYGETGPDSIGRDTP